MTRKPILLLCILMLLSAASLTNAQNTTDSQAIKKLALSHMEAGRYGEAIDQLNKYISANPREPEGYNLRGLCYEKRSQYENARLDFRRAIALEITNPSKKSEYEKNLQRILDVWYPLLNKKIEGHLREIAINPDDPFNYLEIGKSYYWMELWGKAEEWYDKYLSKDDNASPDEIIRYTEILAKTGSIVKGEKVLKKYVERYPEDWRLWSRYGYFTLWLGKYPIAKTAFETALGFKPFFQEAQDGLDMVNNKAYVNQASPRAFEREFPIDRYYRLLRRNPSDVEMRFKLVDELMTAKRYEEAYQQLQIIGNTNPDDPRYKEKLTEVSDIREKAYQAELQSYKTRLEENPDDAEAMKKVAEYYENLQDYPQALSMLDRYFELYPEDTDPGLRFRRARIEAWEGNFDKSIEYTDSLLTEYPNNLDYQLFRAQVSVWTNRDVELANKYLENVLQKEPDNTEALISMGSLKVLDLDYESAQQYADKVKSLDPYNKDIPKLQANIEWGKMRAEEEKVYAILEQGRQRVSDSDCPGALPFYEDYLSKATPTPAVLKEYGDVLFCAKDYQKALQTYGDLLKENYTRDVAMQRAKVFYSMGDSVEAVSAFRELARKDSADYEANLYLGDAYTKMKEYDSARAVYENMLEWKIDSTQTAAVNTRLGYLPLTGLAALFQSLPTYVGLAPASQVYFDNQSLLVSTTGSRIEVGLTNFLTVGVLFNQTYQRVSDKGLDTEILNKLNFTGVKRWNTLIGNLQVSLFNRITAGAGMGISNALNAVKRLERNAFARFEIKDTVSVSLSYQYSDASMILYSPYLIDLRLYAWTYKLEGYYQHRKGLRISGYFNYINVGDGNAGNDLSLRLGKWIYNDLMAGYEYAYNNYKLTSTLYYSPQNFESHSGWLEYYLENSDAMQANLGGKLGFIPYARTITLEGHFSLLWKILTNLSLQGRISMSSTSRYNSGYKSFSAQVSAFWTVF